jgi:hypothetical protein
VIAAAAGGDVDTADDFREEFAVEVGEKDADCAGAAGNEASCPGVWDVVERGCDVANAAAGFFAYWSTAVENAGDGCDGDVGLARDVPDRDNSSGVVSRSVPGAGWPVTIRRKSPWRSM